MELLERFVQGDIEAFEILFRQFQREVYGWIVRIVRDHAFAEDLTVETFWRIYRARARFNPQASFGAWARRIATNLAISHVRRRGRQGTLSYEVPAHSSELMLQCEVRRQIAHAFRRLPAKLRVAATLALIEDRSYVEIAEVLDRPVGTVRTRVSRAVQLLRKHLSQMGVKP